MRRAKYFAHEHHLSPTPVFTDLGAFPAAPRCGIPAPFRAGHKPRAARRARPCKGEWIRPASSQRTERDNEKAQAGVAVVGSWVGRGSFILQGLCVVCCFFFILFFFFRLHSPYLVGL